MDKARKRFLLYAVLAVFVLLIVLLGVINAISFTMAARDADAVTEMIESGRGEFNAAEPPSPSALEQSGSDEELVFQPHGIGPMGPDSPELEATLRYFTAVFDENGGTLSAFHISAVDEDDALAWAGALKGSTGWTRGTYRYRIYERDGKTFVTVIDQGRELLTAYRILIFSVIGAAVGVALSAIVLAMVGKRLFAPIEEADRKQRLFIRNAEKEFKLPLTVMAADTELVEREYGSSDQTRSVNRQLHKLETLVKQLGSLTIFEETELESTEFVLSDMLNESLDRSLGDFKRGGIEVTRSIAEGVTMNGEPSAMRRVVAELIENALKYSKVKAEFTLFASNGRIRLSASNDTELENGSVDQVFDRFTTLKNAQSGSVGLGLAAVKDIVKAHNGRVSAKVADGIFTIRIDL